jgi:hypothetical protein
MARHTLAVFIAHHDNGWDTHVVETAGGDFMAWAAPAGAPGLTRYVEFDLGAAKASAAAHLAQTSGHVRCSAECGAWERELATPPVQQPALA